MCAGDIEHPVRLQPRAELHPGASLGRFGFLNVGTVVYGEVSIGRYFSCGRGAEIGVAPHPLIGPFLDVLPEILEHNYDAILHLRTEAGLFEDGRLRRELGEVWRTEALSALIGSRERVASILGSFRSNPALSQVGPAPHYLSLTHHPHQNSGHLAASILSDGSSGGYFAGAMFWVRPETLRPLVERDKVDSRSFPQSDRAAGGSGEQLLERLFGQAASLNGGATFGAPVEPSEPLIMDLAPSEGTLQTHLEAALRDRRSAHAARSQRALAW
ncbi:hypothetical protein [Microbacterium lacticum]|uniref:hypothetical protein n=1 Tax=Microbacterium lacticum TaxID=33885 RepID=UPI001F55DA0D|nr:hypothetical protein [Microbacterium lacticum]